MQLLDLPDDIFTHCLYNYFDFKQKAVLNRVCKQFNRYFNYVTHKIDLDENFHNSFIQLSNKAELLECLANKVTSVNHLKISSFDTISETFLKYLCRKHKKQIEEQPQNKIKSTVLSNIRVLEYYLKDSKAIKGIFVVPFCVSMRNLKQLTYRESEGSNSIKYFFTSYFHRLSLEYLSIDSADPDFATELYNNISTLKTIPTQLSLEYDNDVCEVNNKIIELCASELLTLEITNVSDYNKVEMPLFESTIKKCSKLRTLAIDEALLDEDFAVTSLTNIFISCKNLVHVNFSLCVDKNIESVFKSLATLTNLEVLKLDICFTETTHIESYNLAPFNKLQYLTIKADGNDEHVGYFNYSVLRHLIRYTPNIKELVLSYILADTLDSRYTPIDKIKKKKHYKSPFKYCKPYNRYSTYQKNYNTGTRAIIDLIINTPITLLFIDSNLIFREQTLRQIRRVISKHQSKLEMLMLNNDVLINYNNE